MEGGGWWVTFYIIIFFSFNLCFVLLFPLMMLFVSEKQLIKQHPFLANYKRAPLLEGLEGKMEKEKKKQLRFKIKYSREVKNYDFCKWKWVE